MEKSLRNIWILLVIIVVPILAYAFLQVKSLEEDEAMAQQIFERQMESVLNSVNTYANDEIERFVRTLIDESNSINENANELISDNKSILVLYLKEVNGSSDTIFYADHLQEKEIIRAKVEDWYHKNDSLLAVLNNYMSAGYQKIQGVESWETIEELLDDQVAVNFMYYDQDSTLFNALAVIQTGQWVGNYLTFKLYEISGDEFRTLVYQKQKEGITYIFETNGFDTKKNYIEKQLWVFPEVYLLVQPIGESYVETIRKRSSTNIYILFAALGIIVIGMLIVIRNIRSTYRLAQLKSDFVSNVSHEIRTPLALIKMYAETLMLGRVRTEEKKNRYYQIIHHESGRLTYLVNNILDFSKIESNKKVYSKTRVNVNRLVKELVDNYSFTFEEKSVNCALHLAKGDIQIEVDKQAFEEAFSNLIENAIKYSEKEIKIEVSTKIVKDKVLVAIKDHGVGIPKKAQDQIFEKFYRVEGALTQKTKGAGLGLSLVHHIMKAHDGQVDVQSKVGEGSTFSLVFPLVSIEDE